MEVALKESPFYGDTKAAVQLVSSTYSGYTGRGVAPELTYRTLVDSYKSWVYISVRKISMTVASLPLNLYAYKRGGKYIHSHGFRSELKAAKTSGDVKLLCKENDVERVKIDSHPFLDLLAKPNPTQVRSALWRQIMMRLELTGSVGVYTPLNRLGQPVQMWTLPLTKDGSVRPIPDREQVMNGFKYLEGDVDRTFDQEEMLYIQYPNPATPYEGMSALKAQTYPYDVDHFLDKFLYYLLKNNAFTGTHFTTDQRLTDERVQDMVKEIKSQWGQLSNTGTPIITHSGFKADKQIGYNLHDLMIDSVETFARDKMLAGYDVPAGKVGLVKDVNRANMEILNETFMVENIRPRVQLIEEYIEQFMLPKYDDRLTCDFELPDFRDKEFDIKERETNLKYGFTTINEERAKEGREEVAWGNEPWLPMNMVQVGSVPESSPAPEPKRNAVEQKGLTSDYWTSERKVNYWNQFKVKTDEMEKLFVKLMRDVFSRQRKEVLDSLEQSKGKQIVGNLAGWSRGKREKWLKDHTRRVEEININRQQEVELLRENAYPVYVEVMEKSGDARLQELLGVKSMKAAFEYDFNINDPEVQQWLGERLRKFSSEVTGTTFDAIDKVLREAFAEGVGITSVSDRLMDMFSAAEKNRAPMIARTETIAASNRADLDAVDQSGLSGKLKKFWINQLDARDTHLHAGERYDENHAIDLKENFLVGQDSMPHPGGGTQAEENINCRCTLGYVEA